MRMDLALISMSSNAPLLVLCCVSKTATPSTGTLRLWCLTSSADSTISKSEILSVANLLDTQMALVEADEGIAIIPSFGMVACRNRQLVMSPLVDPVVSMEFHQITQRGRNLPEGADDFLAFLKTYVSGWAERAGVL